MSVIRFHSYPALVRMERIKLQHRFSGPSQEEEDATEIQRLRADNRKLRERAARLQGIASLAAEYVNASGLNQEIAERKLIKAVRSCLNASFEIPSANGS